MTKVHRQKLERLVGKLRQSHDRLGALIECKPKAALRLLEKMRDQLYDVVTTYDAVIQKLSRDALKADRRRAPTARRRS
jgi:hypothetical protein